jgi:hypothetical protein
LEGRSPPFSPSINASTSADEDVAANKSQLADDSDTQSTLEDVPTSLKSLPTISRTADHQIFLVRDDVETFLKMELDMSRLNKIHGHLWMAGRPLNARPLQRQKMMGFDIVPTEQADLHLLKFSHRLLVKPLPEYIIDFDFWNKYLCSSKELHESACGLLLSYIWLICSPLDLELAHELHLLPPRVTWQWWKAFVTDFCSHVDVNALDQVNKRYHFGELRLRRINSIYRIRFFFTHFIRGYLYGYNRYVVFFQRNFAWMLMLFANFSLILSAMQAASTVPSLNASKAFQTTTYGFVIFSVFAVAFFLGTIGAIFGSIYIFNMVAAILHVRRETFKRQKLAQERRKKGKDA